MSGKASVAFGLVAVSGAIVFGDLVARTGLPIPATAPFAMQLMGIISIFVWVSCSIIAIGTSFIPSEGVGK